MIHYLTVQDILWINHEVTKKIDQFKYLQLEEATNLQYGYVKSENVLQQAGTFIEGFMKLRPFTEGNRKTAFVSTLAFLKINGYDIVLDPDDAVSWAVAVADGKKRGVDAICEIIGERTPPSLAPTVRTEVRHILEKYSAAIEQLSD
jgi:death-on-curing protein